MSYFGLRELVEPIMDRKDFKHFRRVYDVTHVHGLRSSGYGNTKDSARTDARTQLKVETRETSTGNGQNVVAVIKKYKRRHFPFQRLNVFRDPVYKYSAHADLYRVETNHGSETA